MSETAPTAVAPGKTWQDYGREWLDTFVVAISVAMCFRAYFYQPFNIPTGSMRPTLYGNHYRTCENPGFWDTNPVFKWGQWLWNGYHYKELKSPCEGTLVVTPRHDGRMDLKVYDRLGRQAAGICVPTDAPLTDGLRFETDQHADQRALRARVVRGQKIFSGYDVTGDFIFVNRWLWNFRRPARGDVMVFSTTGMGERDDGRYVGTDGRRYVLQQGTHYIKRMAGVPGETIDLKVSPTLRQPDGAPGYDLVVDGVRTEYFKPEGARGEPTLAPCPVPGTHPDKVWNPPYVLRDEPGARDYLAFGDNSYPVSNSFDGRYFGPVPERNLRGCAAVVFWPFNPRWGAIK